MLKQCLIALALAGCGGSKDDEDAAPARPTQCSMSDATGTYLAHFTEKSGNCGALPDTLTRLGGAQDPNCTDDQPDTWSENDCKIETASTCHDAGANQDVSEIGVLTETQAGGEQYDGTVTFTVRDANGVELCLETYGVTFTRQ